MSNATLQITESSKDSIHIISLVGEIDAKTAPHLKQALDSALASGKRKIALDFTSLTYISSAGIGVLNAFLHALKNSNGTMVIANPSKTVRDTLDVMYFSKKVSVYPDLSSAINGLK
ncbi:MAG: STAS domain-containing protein [Spirochaetes bacterium]|nr:STAS domain-containing protein [Spirochaetota bacterium]